jgi:hypothetical protein
VVIKFFVKEGLTPNEIHSKFIRGALKSSRAKNKKNEFIILNLFLFFNIISLKANTFIPAMLQRHYPVPVTVLRKICKTNVPVHRLLLLSIYRSH